MVPFPPPPRSAVLSAYCAVTVNSLRRAVPAITTTTVASVDNVTASKRHLSITCSTKCDTIRNLGSVRVPSIASQHLLPEMVRVQSGPPPLLPATLPPPTQPSRPAYETQTSRTSGSSSEDFVIVEPSQGVLPQQQQLQQQQYGVQNSGTAISADSPIIPPGSAPETETTTPSTNPRVYYVPIDSFLAGEAILELDYDELQARVRTLLAENELLQESIYQSNDSIQRQLRVSQLRIANLSKV